MSEGSVVQERLRSSLWLCVRSVRHMTEQLVTIISSLDEGDCREYRGPRSRLCSRPSSQHCSPFEESRSFCEFSSSESCSCVNDYCHFESLSNGNIMSQKSFPSNNGKLSKPSSMKHSQKLEISSQTTGERLQDKQSYTTPDIATQTHNGLSTIIISPIVTEDSLNKTKINQTDNNFLPHIEITSSDMTIRTSKFPSWDQLIRSQIEEAISRKISEKLSQRFDSNVNIPLENVKAINSHYVANEKSLNPNLNSVIGTQSSKLNEKTMSQNIISIIPEHIKESQLNAISIKTISDTNNKYTDNPSAKPLVENISKSNNQMSVSGPYSLNNAKVKGKLSDDYFYINSYKMQVEPIIEESENIKKDSLSSETFTYQKIEKTVDLNLDLNNSQQSQMKCNSESNSEIFSIFDEFDYVSEVELQSLSSSEKESAEIFGITVGMSVYNSTLIKDNDYEKVENSNLKVKNSKRSDDTIVSSEMSEPSVDCSAFSKIISNSDSSLPPSILSSWSNKTEDFDKSNVTQLLSFSDKTKYIYHIKSVNTLSSSIKEKSVKYKSINVTNLDRNDSNNKSGSNSRISFNPSSSLDISSICMKNVSPKETLNFHKNSYENCINLKSSQPFSKGIGRNELHKKTVKLENIVNKKRMSESKSNRHKLNVIEKDPYVEYPNINQHNSESFLFEEIFIEPYIDGDQTNSLSNSDISGHLDNVRIIDVSLPSKGSHSRYSGNTESVYYNVEDVDEKSIALLENIIDNEDPVTKTETIFLQATLEINNGTSKKTDSKLYKIHFEKNSFSIQDDDEAGLVEFYNDSRQLDNIVSCFDTVTQNIEISDKPKNTKFHIKKNKRKVKKSSDKKKNLKNVLNYNLVECYLDDFGINEENCLNIESLDHGKVITVNKVDCY